MNKNLVLILVISFSMFLWSCGSNNNSSNEYEDDSNVENSVDANKNTPVGEDSFGFTGTYESKTGVMTDISCYCFQVGYFYADNGEKFIVCFPDGTEEAACSENLKINGYFETVKIDPDDNSSCSAGEREIFYVTDFECM